MVWQEKIGTVPEDQVACSNFWFKWELFQSVAVENQTPVFRYKGMLNIEILKQYTVSMSSPHVTCVSVMKPVDKESVFCSGLES